MGTPRDFAAEGMAVKDHIDIGTALGAIIPLLIRWGWLRRILFPTRTSPGPTSTGGSSLDTAFLKVALDHATGRMTGEVIAGRHRGRRLEDLTAAETVELLDEARGDPATVQVLEAFLDREHPGWSGTGRTPSSPSSGSMSRAEALQILDLAEGASPEQIREAHRRLMLANHPDRGGSTFLAAQINRAKDVLLGEGGNDFISGDQSTTDTVSGGDGDDTIIARRSAGLAVGPWMWFGRSPPKVP